MVNMYTSFYNLKEKPFEITPDPRFLYLSKSHREALAHLVYAVKERKGFTVITGEVGTGKTVLIQTLLSRLDGKTRVAYLFNPKLGPNEFLNYICEDLGLKGLKKYKVQYLNILHSFLLNCHTMNENVVLIVDEAQNLVPELLEEIRLLTNFETSRGKLLQVILMGQPEFDDTLDRSDCRQLRQRVTLRYHLEPLNEDETREYIKHRLKKAGGLDPDFFTSKAIDKIYRYSKGIPRVINILCDNALVIGFAREKRIIGDEIIWAAIRDREGPRFRKRYNRLRAIRLACVGAVVLLGSFFLWEYEVFQAGKAASSHWIGIFIDTMGRAFQEIWQKISGLL